MGEIRKEVLETYIFDTTKSIALFDKYEGLGNENTIIYDRIVLNNYRCGRTSDGIVFSYKLIIERCEERDYVGNITFTKFKKGKDSELREYVISQVDKDIMKEYSKTKKIFYFNKPYLLRAQNSKNRSGYGWKWDWSDGLGTACEGTYYGETTQYVFAGILINP